MSKPFFWIWKAHTIKNSNKKHPSNDGCFFQRKKLSFFFHFCEAFAAVYWAIFTWSEWNFSFAAAASASSSEHFSFYFFTSFASISAVFASLWFILEAFFCVEFLFTSGEYEFSSTFFAYQFFVFVHDHIPRFMNLPTD